ncbi:MAG TPA: ABC transporter substrate-binding protein [Micromonosporaceae bacterium]
MSQMDRRQALRLLTALGAAGLAAACGTDRNEPAAESANLEPIRIGLIAPQAGGNKPIGDELVRGFQLFLQLNDQQLGGHPVNLLILDEGNDARTATTSVNGALKQGVLALTGVVDSGVMLGIRDLVERARVPLVGSNASPSALQSVVYIWRTSYVSDEPGRALGPYVAQHVSENGEVAIVAPDYPAGRDAVEGFRQHFGDRGVGDPRIGEPVLWTPYTTNPDKKTYAETVGTLRERNPEALYCFFAGAAAIAFIQQLRGVGYRNQIYAPGFLTEGNVLKELGDDALGIRTALNYSADLNNAANRRFATAFRKAHGTSPTTYAMASYDAARVLDKAIRLAGDRPTPQDVNLALGKVGQIDSPRGPWQFNQPRTPQQKWYLREVRKDGQVLANMLMNELATLG